MKILIVEDDPDKKDAIIAFINTLELNVEIVAKESTSSGLQEIIFNDDIDFIILDMSMPTFDMTEEDPTGGGPESFAGKEFIEQMYLREIDIPVVVVSQLGSFGKGNSKKSLSSLDIELKEAYFTFYIGAIYYNYAMDDWKEKLEQAITLGKLND
jgi:CheY-like chemotaxis protein